MGLQQTLFLMLVVIIVGISVSVALYAFNEQAVNLNRSAVIADMNLLAADAISYYKTPVMLGGGEGIWAEEELYEWLNRQTTPNGKRIITQNGEIAIRVRNHGYKLVFTGYGYETGFDDINAVKARLVLAGPEADPKLVFLN